MPSELPFVLPVIRYADTVLWPPHNMWGRRRLYDHELLYVLSGDLDVELDRRLVEMGPDHLILIPPRVEQAFWTRDQSHTHIGIHFDWVPRSDTPGFLRFRPAVEPYEDSLFREPLTIPNWDHATYPSLDLRGRPRVRQLLLDVVASHAASGEYAPVQAGALLAAAIAAAAHEAGLISDLRANPHIGADAVRRVHRARELLEEPRRNPLSVAEAAQRVNWSPDHLNRMCLQVLGTSPSRLAMKARLQRARQLLEFGELSVGEVARACGFEDAAYFAAVFKKESGYTPRQYVLERE